MTGNAKAPLLPPTVPYHSFKAMLRVFQQHGAPAVVDHGALRKRFAPGSVDALLSALRFLSLIDASGAPTGQLGALTAALDTVAWPQALGAALRGAYGVVLEEGLENATPAQLNQRLRSAFSLPPEACRRSATFLLAAAQDADISVSPYLVAPPRSKGRLLPAKHENGHAHDEEPSGDALTARLIEKFPAFDPSWPDALKEHWFVQFNELIQLVKPDDRPAWMNSTSQR